MSRKKPAPDFDHKRVHAGLRRAMGGYRFSEKDTRQSEHVLQRWKRPASGLAEEIVAQQIVEAALPRIVAVAADIDAPDEFHLSGFHVLHVDIDVEDEVAHLLYSAPGGLIRAGLAREVALAAIAVADRGAACDLPLDRGRDTDDPETAGRVEFCTEQVVQQPDARAFGRSGRLKR